LAARQKDVFIHLLIHSKSIITCYDVTLIYRGNNTSRMHSVRTHTKA